MGLRPFRVEMWLFRRGLPPGRVEVWLLRAGLWTTLGLPLPRRLGSPTGGLSAEPRR
jgi:hypothetical protein